MTRQQLPRMTIAVAGLAMSLIALPVSAQNRRGSDGGGGTPAVARPSSPPPTSSPAPSPAPAPTQPATDRGGDRGRSGNTTSGDGQNDNGSARRNGDGQVVGAAVPRNSGPGRPGHGGVIIVPGGYGFSPWGYGGLGFGGYYGGYYDPGFGFGDGGYGGGYADPGYPSQNGGNGGALRIKVTPRDAAVYVDGYFVGHVDDFDGVLQKLHLSPGPHRLELRDSNYESLTFDVRIDSAQTITYRGEMKKTS
jgi:hypothetical protein